MLQLLAMALVPGYMYLMYYLRCFEFFHLIIPFVQVGSAFVDCGAYISCND